MSPPPFITRGLPCLSLLEVAPKLLDLMRIDPMPSDTASHASRRWFRPESTMRFAYANALSFVSVLFLCKAATPPDMIDDRPAFVHDITVKDIKGNDVKQIEYVGKVLLIVNMASKCGLTNSNYKELNVLYEKYKEKGFRILTFPCNQFVGQEPGSNEEIEQTVCTRFKA
ncbi:hypothetical protein GUJ93_ZPchr0003g18296 [Zizania palustris]|uniref:Glutathione peroxidase n=1 Tax=Zizania palustris TaxID=103762 RepID=A0A8J5SF21_ZIZPA|nr:hypothetical protein GUJ93_ZPchr0003g18296 [Zizania palustris]